jgi:hypothetical protein
MVSIAARVLLFALVALGLNMVMSVFLSSRADRTGMGLVPVAMFAAGLFGYRRYRGVWRPRWAAKKTYAADRAVRVAAWEAHQRRPDVLAANEAWYAKLRQLHLETIEAKRLEDLRGLLAYDLETQQTWNYDGTRKTPREQVVATMDTYTFEVTPAKYRIMQEWFDDALEPGVYTFKKERSGPVRIEQ